jgi:hypothetical protein
MLSTSRLNSSAAMAKSRCRTNFVALERRPRRSVVNCPLDLLRGLHAQRALTSGLALEGLSRLPQPLDLSMCLTARTWTRIGTKHSSICANRIASKLTAQ